jgi:hypothetical protein
MPIFHEDLPNVFQLGSTFSFQVVDFHLLGWNKMGISWLCGFANDIMMWYWHIG